MDPEEDLEAPWPAVFAAILWGILSRLSLSPADRDEKQHEFKQAFEEAIQLEGTIAVSAKLDAVMRAATYRRPHERRALAHAALEKLFTDRWSGFIDELFDEE